MELQTHLLIDSRFSGTLTKLSHGYAEVTFPTHIQTVANSNGLVHGGFMFSAADFAAMAAINHPDVVLASASVRFVAPTFKGDVVRFCATVTHTKKNKHTIKVQGHIASKLVFEGEFLAVIPPKPLKR